MSLNEKALENIRAVIEQQETEWLKDNGYEPIPHKPEPRILRRNVKEGNFSADRFLGNASPAPAHEPEPQQELAPVHAPEEPQQDNSPEAVEIIPQKDGRHSWLYNEVMKAIRDAAGDDKNTKVIAIFVPVVQNGKEFDDLPVSAKVELSPVDEADVRIDLADISAETPAPVEPEPVEEPVHIEPEPAEEHLPEPLEEPEELPAIEPEPEAASEPTDHVGDLLPAEHIEHDPELVEAFNTMEEKLDEHIAGAHDEAEDQEEEPEGLLPLPDPAEIEGFSSDDDGILDEEIDEENAPVQMPESAQSSEDFAFSEEEIIDEPEEVSTGEKMSFTEITLPPALEDDEVLDDNIKL